MSDPLRVAPLQTPPSVALDCGSHNGHAELHTCYLGWIVGYADNRQSQRRSRQEESIIEHRYPDSRTLLIALAQFGYAYVQRHIA